MLIRKKFVVVVVADMHFRYIRELFGFKSKINENINNEKFGKLSSAFVAIFHPSFTAYASSC